MGFKRRPKPVGSYGWGPKTNQPEGKGLGPKNNNPLETVANITGNYNYAAGTSQINLYDAHNFAEDITITAQSALTYSNGSNTTLTLFPVPGIRDSVPGEHGYSLNGTYNAQEQLTIGQGQELQYEAARSLTGINLNPITGEIHSRIAMSVGSVTFTQQLNVKGSIRPFEAGMMTVAALGVAIFAAQGVPGVREVVDTGLLKTFVEATQPR
jgi:hypothetical protein